LDRSGKEIVIKAEGMLSRVLQHEIDHFGGNPFHEEEGPRQLSRILLIWRSKRKNNNIKKYGKKRYKIRTIFMGTSEFAAEILESLVNAGYNIVSVYTQPDKKVGRDQEVKARR